MTYHADTIREAWVRLRDMGFRPMTELRLDGAVLDAVVAGYGRRPFTPLVVAEVKSDLSSQGQVTAAVLQVCRYRQALGCSDAYVIGPSPIAHASDIAARHSVGLTSPDTFLKVMADLACDLFGGLHVPHTAVEAVA